MAEIKSLFIFEIMGKPAEHIVTTMSQLIDKLGELPGIKINNRKIHEPKPVETKDLNETSDLFTTFSEVEIHGKDIYSLINVMFNAMPSHVEIIEPDEVVLNNHEISNLLTDLTLKLHRYDEIAKALMIERNVLIGKLKEMGVQFTTPGQKQEQSQESKKEENKSEEKKLKIKKTKKK